MRGGGGGGGGGEAWYAESLACSPILIFVVFDVFVCVTGSVSAFHCNQQFFRPLSPYLILGQLGKLQIYACMIKTPWRSCNSVIRSYIYNI